MHKLKRNSAIFYITKKKFFIFYKFKTFKSVKNILPNNKNKIYITNKIITNNRIIQHKKKREIKNYVKKIKNIQLRHISIKTTNNKMNKITFKKIFCKDKQD